MKTDSEKSLPDVKTGGPLSSSSPIAITGASIICSLGTTRQETWANILAGKNGFGKLTALEIPLPDGKDGGQAMELPSDYLPDLPREVRYLHRAIRDAINDAGLLDSGRRRAPSARDAGTDDVRPPRTNNRVSCLLGTTLHGMRSAGQFFRQNDFEFLRHFLAGSTLEHSLPSSPDQPRLVTGFVGTTCSACSSSLGSIAMAVTMLQTNQADIVIAGGYDTISEYVYGGFNSLRLVADGPLRPFARDRKGMKLAEGYGIVILERHVDAIARKANILAHILGYGESADAHHLTQPHPQGDGAARAIRQAITAAQIRPEQIDFIAAHATGTPDNDSGEHAAFSAVFASALPDIPVTAFKSHLGHTLGGAGAIELILSAMALENQIVPPAANVSKDEVEFPSLNLVTSSPIQKPIEISLNTSLGFGGANTCVILQRGSDPVSTSAKLSQTKILSASAARSPLRKVFITGVGVIAPGMVGNEAFARLTSGRESINRDTGAIAEETIYQYLNARRVRRMSDYVKLTLASANVALTHAGITDVPAFAADCAAILGSMHGSSNFSAAYYKQIIDEGLIAANPAMFAEAVPNAGAAQLSLMLGIKGACQTIIGTRTSGLDALSLAALRIADGSWNHAIVSAGEEYCDLVNRAYEHCNLKLGGSSAEGFFTGAGAVTFVLESEESVTARNAKPLAKIGRSAFQSNGREKSIESLLNVIASLNDEHHPVFIGSSCNTWIDQAESIALRKSAVKYQPSLYGLVAETFSASAFFNIAAKILTVSDSDKSAFAGLCTDFGGQVTGVRFDVI